MRRRRALGIGVMGIFFGTVWSDPAGAFSPLDLKRLASTHSCADCKLQNVNTERYDDS